MIVKSLISSLLFIVVFVVVYWIYGAIKAAKDPDVKEATHLGMSIIRYRKYKDAFGKIQGIYEKHGLSSSASEKEVTEIISSLPNMNEWRKYSEYQSQKSTDRLKNRIDKLENL